MRKGPFHSYPSSFFNDGNNNEDEKITRPGKMRTRMVPVRISPLCLPYSLPPPAPMFVSQGDRRAIYVPTKVAFNGTFYNGGGCGREDLVHHVLMEFDKRDVEV